MHSLTIILTSILAGICLFAAYLHLMAGLRPIDKVQLWFSAICVSIAILALALLDGFRAQTIEEMAVALKLQITLALLFTLFFPWLVTELTGRRHFGWMLLANSLTLALIVYNLTQPYSLQLTSIDGLKQVMLIPTHDIHDEWNIDP
jgi:hypothetical protein